ncbi:2-keto-3-deoxygalactonate kinase [Arboricoccus pini]|uniref:2-keto-3-deoxygalactonate kinase n=1 Tax=Arboricoccus pini TaxID=1963835 RepID=A0A212PZS6_9PROT|nr:2-dehydro-3-deoxygalactonokinase [Arboricoccus pini]SNB52464.1 2-keto-3-deoxygalactonate kinase [Arboricoccus pini]
MTGPALIALDWGTTSLRAYLLADDGRILDRRQAKAGILQIEGGRFHATLETLIAAWQTAHGRLPLITSGMIGSRQGWVEAPYLACPASLDGLAARLVVVPLGDGGRLHVVPGLAVEGDLPDVMRGEETELVGLGAMQDGGLYVLPGTHSKWVLAQGGRIEGFKTYMTGEIFAVLKDHSILGRLMSEGPADEAAFLKGVDVGLEADDRLGGLLHAVFSARTLPLMDRLPATSVAPYLSGILIGAEIQAGRSAHGDRTATLVGGGPLVDLYALAMQRAGLAFTSTPADAAARGLFIIAGAAGLMGR